MEVQVHLITGILFPDFGITIPHGQYTMKTTCGCSLVKVTQREMYSTTEIDLVDNYTDSPTIHHILEHPNKAMLKFTRYLLIIDFIVYSSL
jgi:hypothetical protein